MTFCIFNTGEAAKVEVLFATVLVAELAAEDDFLALLTNDSKKDVVGLSMAFIIQL